MSLAYSTYDLPRMSSSARANQTFLRRSTRMPSSNTSGQLKASFALSANAKFTGKAARPAQDGKGQRCPTRRLTSPATACVVVLPKKGDLFSVTADPPLRVVEGTHVEAPSRSLRSLAAAPRANGGVDKPRLTFGDTNGAGTPPPPPLVARRCASPRGEGDWRRSSLQGAEGGFEKLTAVAGTCGIASAIEGKGAWQLSLSWRKPAIRDSHVSLSTRGGNGGVGPLATLACDVSFTSETEGEGDQHLSPSRKAVQRSSTLRKPASRDSRVFVSTRGDDGGVEMS